MTGPPKQLKICHITHVDNLPGIIEQGGLWSDAKRIELSLNASLVGMSEIKRRRLEELEVTCHPGTKVGQYVPFYFCPRSIMLYILYRRNHDSISYEGGQAPIVHLVADFEASVQWVESNNGKWAITPTNADARYTDFFKSRDDLKQINWDAVNARDFRSSEIKDGKQAEFLLQDLFPWTLVEQIGVYDQNTESTAMNGISAASHQPPVRIQNGWYF